MITAKIGDNELMEWKLIDSKIVFDNFTQIQERTYQMPDGKISKYYIKLNRPAVSILALTQDNEVLVVEQFRPGPGRVLQELPGGYVDEGETDHEAAERELLEETGYAGKISLVTACYDDAYTTMLRSCFVATDCRKIAKQNLGEGEFIHVRLLPLPEFKAVVRSGMMTDVEVAMLGMDHLQLL